METFPADALADSLCLQKSLLGFFLIRQMSVFYSGWETVFRVWQQCHFQRISVWRLPFLCKPPSHLVSPAWIGHAWNIELSHCHYQHHPLSFCHPLELYIFCCFPPPIPSCPISVCSETVASPEKIKHRKVISPGQSVYEARPSSCKWNTSFCLAHCWAGGLVQSYLWALLLSQS